MDVFHTGFTHVDDKLGGGIPAGSMVSYEFPPHSAGELVLWTLLRRGFDPDARKPNLNQNITSVYPDEVAYLTSGKRPQVIRTHLSEEYDSTQPDAVDPSLTIERVEPIELGPGGDDTDLEDLEILDLEGDNPVVVVDSLSPFLEQGGNDWRVLLTQIRSVVEEQDGLAVLSLTRGDRSLLPNENRVTQLCDGHFRYDPTDGNKGERDRLIVQHLRRARGAQTGFPQRHRLEIHREVTIDTTESR